ncbi:hypothetical protein HN446_04645 [bacterium]|jgi:hypothetical protein|nr:hypothetical protein [bacterium]
MKKVILSITLLVCTTTVSYKTYCGDGWWNPIALIGAAYNAAQEWYAPVEEVAAKEVVAAEEIIPAQQPRRNPYHNMRATKTRHRLTNPWVEAFGKPCTNLSAPHSKHPPKKHGNRKRRGMNRGRSRW